MYYKLEISRIINGAKNPFFYNVFTFKDEKISYKYLSTLSQTQRPYKNSYIVLELGTVEVNEGLNYKRLEKITIENAPVHNN